MATASEPPPPPPSASHPVTSPRPELDACVTSPYSAASASSEQTELTEESASSPGGLEWLRCDYGGGQGEPSLEWQVSALCGGGGRLRWWCCQTGDLAMCYVGFVF